MFCSAMLMVMHYSRGWARLLLVIDSEDDDEEME